MSKTFFRNIENSEQGSRFDAEDILSQLSFNDQGLIPAITQEATTGQVLMMAWMNKMALHSSLQSGRMTYWSRSRNTLWKKGESSGHQQRIISLQLDCDGDALLFQVEQTGAACHTGRKHCFYFSFDRQSNQFVVASEPQYS